MNKESQGNERKPAAKTAAAKQPAGAQGAKRTNRSWEAFGKSKGCFIVNDPKFSL